MGRRNKNFLDYIPKQSEAIAWDVRNGIMTFHMKNKGFFAWLAQKLFHRPAYSYVQLEQYGSFIWPMIDGKTSIYDIAEAVKWNFGEKAEPLYGRIAEYFATLYQHHFIEWERKKQ